MVENLGSDKEPSLGEDGRLFGGEQGERLYILSLGLPSISRGDCDTF